MQTLAGKEPTLVSNKACVGTGERWQEVDPVGPPAVSEAAPASKDATPEPAPPAPSSQVKVVHTHRHAHVMFISARLLQL